MVLTAGSGWLHSVITRDEIWVSLGVLASATIVGILGYAGKMMTEFFSRLKSKLNRVLHQVENTHQTNLRDDIDRQNELLREVSTTVKSLCERIAGLEETVNDLKRDSNREHSELWDAITDNTSRTSKMINAQAHK